jgi:hypothetical protein
MSGGHYEYAYAKIEYLADDIKKEFARDGKYMGEDWSCPSAGFSRDRPMIEKNYFDDATPEQRKILLKEIRSLIKDLYQCSKRAKALEWFMSSDTGIESYIEELNEIYKKKK